MNSPSRQKPVRLLALVLCTSCLVLSVSAVAVAKSGAAEELARQLVELRAEVEALAGEVDQIKVEARSQARLTAQQRSDLELQLQREEMRLQKLRQAHQAHQQTIASASSAQAELKPAMLEALATIRVQIARGLPFKRDERLAALDDLQRQLTADKLAPHTAANRLWGMVEDELRLARESGLYQQTIELDGEEVLADVARIGMITLYFRAPDGRVGKTLQDPDTGQWRYVVLAGEEEQQRITELFDAFQKGLRVGYFELPQPFGPPGTAISFEGGER